MNTYNEKRQLKYAKRYFIGCEEMLLKRLRKDCKINEADFTDEQLLSLIGMFEMYGCTLMNKAKGFHVAPCYMKSNCTPNSYSTILSNFSIMYKVNRLM